MLSHWPSVVAPLVAYALTHHCLPFSLPNPQPPIPNRTVSQPPNPTPSLPPGSGTWTLRSPPTRPPQPPSAPSRATATSATLWGWQCGATATWRAAPRTTQSTSTTQRPPSVSRRTASGSRPRPRRASLQRSWSSAAEAWQACPRLRRSTRSSALSPAPCRGSAAAGRTAWWPTARDSSRCWRWSERAGGGGRRASPLAVPRPLDPTWPPWHGGARVLLHHHLLPAGKQPRPRHVEA